MGETVNQGLWQGLGSLCYQVNLNLPGKVFIHSRSPENAFRVPNIGSC